MKGDFIMTKSNPIFEAMSNIDDEIAANAIESVEKNKRKKPMLFVMIAVAALFSLLVGFTTANESFGLRFGTNGSEHGFNLNLTSQELTIPEEYKTPTEGQHFRSFVDIPPSELFPKFGITMLTSDNFTDTEEVKYKREAGDETATWEPYLNILLVDDDFIAAEIDYFLYDKNIDKTVWFKAEYISDVDRVNAKYHTYHYGVEENNAETVTLNDGSLCLVSNNGAMFAYNGVRYEIYFDYGEEKSAELYKQVLADLEIYTPTADTN